MWKFVRFFALGITISQALYGPMYADDARDAGLNPAIPVGWNQWRGPFRTGAAAANVAWPASLQEDSLRQQWRVPLRESYSGPVVSSELVFTTESVDNEREAVRAYDRKSGEARWQASWEGGMTVPFFAKANGSWIRSTPIYDDDGFSLYVGGMKDVLVCLDAKTGEVRWQVDFAEALKTNAPAFGFVCSPLIRDKFLYVQAGGGVCKLNKETGKILWHELSDGGGMQGGAFSSPVIATICGLEQLVVQTREELTGLALDSGNLLWSQEIPAFRGMNILTPTIVGDSIFTSAYGGKSLMFLVNRAGDSFEVTEQWVNKATAYMSSPVVINNHLYMHLRNQRFTCIDLATGKSRWTSKPFGKYWSLVANGNKILALDEEGELLLIKANLEEFEIIDRRTVSEDPAWAHLAVDGNQLFVRELNGLASYSWSDGAIDLGQLNKRSDTIDPATFVESNRRSE